MIGVVNASAERFERGQTCSVVLRESCCVLAWLDTLAQRWLFFLGWVPIRDRDPLRSRHFLSAKMNLKSTICLGPQSCSFGQAPVRDSPKMEAPVNVM